VELARQAAVRNGAVLFAGDLRLSPEARIRRDVVLTEGSATLEGSSAIAGSLYLNPSPRAGGGRITQADDAQITGGVVRPDDIDSVAAKSLGIWLGWRVLGWIAMPLIGIGTLIAMLIYLVWHSRSREARAGGSAPPAEMGLQPTPHGAA
jgi:hypothetical protein